MGPVRSKLGSAPAGLPLGAAGLGYPFPIAAATKECKFRGFNQPTRIAHSSGCQQSETGPPGLKSSGGTQVPSGGSGGRNCFLILLASRGRLYPLACGPILHLRAIRTHLCLSDAHLLPPSPEDPRRTSQDDIPPPDPQLHHLQSALCHARWHVCRSEDEDGGPLGALFLPATLSTTQGSTCSCIHVSHSAS